MDTGTERRTLQHEHGRSTIGWNYAEEWTFRNRPLERHKVLVSYPWTYRWQDARLPNGMGTPLTQEEITAFKRARTH